MSNSCFAKSSGNRSRIASCGAFSGYPQSKFMSPPTFQGPNVLYDSCELYGQQTGGYNSTAYVVDQVVEPKVGTLQK